MIEKQTIDGRPALVAYLDDEFNPVSQDKATVVKVVFTDAEGGTLFLTPTKPAEGPAGANGPV